MKEQEKNREVVFPQIPSEASKESVGCGIKNPEVFPQIPSEASRESVGCGIMKTRRRFSNEKRKN